jgi:hypothetical protein
VRKYDVIASTIAMMLTTNVTTSNAWIERDYSTFLLIAPAGAQPAGERTP